MAATTRFGTSLMGLIKEEVIIEDSEDEVMLIDEEEGEGEEIGEEEDEEEPYIGEGLFAFPDFDEAEREDDVPEHDPLGTEYDMIVGVSHEEENDENLDSKPVNLPSFEELKYKGVTPVLDRKKFESTSSDAGNANSKMSDNPLVITSVTSLQPTVESVVGSTAKLVPACFPTLDVFRCFLCRKDYDTFDDFLIHRTKAKIHLTVPYDAEREKSFSCGICMRPWNQPRKALACAMFGHNPSVIYESMFVHACPLCPENSLAFHSLSAVGRHWAKVHPNKPMPPFLNMCTGNDQLPSIKVTLREINKVTESMIQEKPELVLENFPYAERCRNVISSNAILKVYRCIDCKRNFETRGEVDIHRCLAKSLPIILPIPSKPRQLLCEDCGREFNCGRNFRQHLLRAGVCRKEGIQKEDFPYKCIFCGSRYNSFKAYLSHRLKGHAEIPYSTPHELPYACKICLKPAFVQKEAMICALFGHDPTGLRKAMFKYKCSECQMSFGFHSTFALKRHWESEHPNLSLPTFLQEVTTDKPLPTVTITLDQLLSLKRLRDFGSTLVIEREIHPTLAMYVRNKPGASSYNAADEASFSIDLGDAQTKEVFQSLSKVSKHAVEVAFLSHDSIQNSVHRSLVEESVEKKMCVICNKTFKDIRRHFKIHDQTRFAGAPTHKCVCGKEYHIRNSLHSHWKKNKACKARYFEQKADETKENIASSKSQEYVLRIPSPVHTIEDQAIKIEIPEIITVYDDETEALMSSGINQLSPEKATTDFKNATLDTQKATSVPMEIETLDLRNYIHLDIEEVEMEGDYENNFEAVPVPVENVSFTHAVEPKKHRTCVCVICNTKFPTQRMFMNHLANDHKDTRPHQCRHCGKRFKLLCQRKKHERIHDPNRFKGEPKFVCDICGDKYYVKESLDSHRKIVHLGYAKPRSRGNLPVMQHRTIGVTRTKPLDSIECTECNVKFNYACQLRQHVQRVHAAEKPYKCTMCDKAFLHSVSLSAHVSRTHDKEEGKQSIVMKSLEKKSSPNMKSNAEVKRYSCRLCPRSFDKPFLLAQHGLLHTGEKPHKCDQCDLCFRLKRSLKSHKLIHESDRKSDLSYKCCVCGLRFVVATQLHRHRLKAHKSIPYNKEMERAFGCGVCGKPYFLRWEAMACAILGHDSTHLQEVMFKHKCPQCPEERLGYHNLASLRTHWTQEHPHDVMPTMLIHALDDSVNVLPCITISRASAAEIKENGPKEAYDFPLVTEFDILHPEISPQQVSASPLVFNEIEPHTGLSDGWADEELFLSAVITREEALKAVKAVVTSDSLRTAAMPRLRREKPSSSSPKKCNPKKPTVTNFRDSVAAERALGNNRIAKVLERIRTARARKGALIESCKSDTKSSTDKGRNVRQRSKK